MQYVQVSMNEAKSGLLRVTQKRPRHSAMTVGMRDPEESVAEVSVGVIFY